MNKKINMKKRICVSFFILILSISIGSIVYATISKSTPSTFEYGDGDTISTWYATGLQAPKIVYAIQDSRYYTVYPKYISAQSQLQVHYSYSAIDNGTSWTEAGLMGSYAYIVASAGHLEEYPAGSMISLTYSNETGYLWATWQTVMSGNRVNVNKGEIQGDGSVIWTAYILSDVFSSGGYHVVIDPTGKPIVSVSGNNASVYNTGIFFSDSINPSESGNWSTKIECDSFGDGERFSMIFPLDSSYEVYVIEGDGENTNTLRGGYINSSISDWGVLPELSDNQVKIWQDDNNIRFMDWSLSYDNVNAYVCYTDVNYDLYYFTINVSSLEKSSETLVINGTSSYHPFQPTITVSDYTPSIFYWNKSSGSSLTGCVIELDEENSWTTDDLVNVYSTTWLSTSYQLSSGMLNSNNGIALIGYGSNLGTYYGSDYNFEGYGLPESPPPPPEEREDPFDWGNVKYMLAIIVFFIITVFAIYIKKSVR